MNIITEEETDRIVVLCGQYNILDYSINDDGSIDVYHDIYLRGDGAWYTLPLCFNTVDGSFDCTNNRLTTLIGSPRVVTGDFNCSMNDLTSLEHSPITVGGDFLCYGNNLVNLIGITVKVVGDLSCHNNLLTSLEGCPKEVGGELDCCRNEISTLEHYRLEDGNLSCLNNKLPYVLTKMLHTLSREEQIIFLKYQKYYDVWMPGLNIDGMNDLVAEIRDGLK
jgi:hypothetical protein